SFQWWRFVTNEGGTMNSLLHEIRLALRSLVNRPGFALVAILTLALGIGASTAIFSVLDAVLLRPLPYPNQERLVEVSELNESGRAMPFTEPNFNDLGERNRSAEAVAGGIEPVRTNVSGISSDFFRVLGVAPALGRLISAETLREGNNVVVVSYGFWKGALEGRTNLEGIALRFANRSFAVIGV